MNVKKRTKLMGISGAAVATTGVVVAWAGSSYTESFPSGASFYFTNSLGTSTSTLTFGSNSSCTGTKDLSTGQYTQSSCSLANGTGTIGNTNVNAIWTACSGSGSRPPGSNTYTSTKTYSLRLQATNQSFDCSTSCNSGSFSITSTADQANNGELAFISSSPGPVFAISATCSSTARATLNNALVNPQDIVGDAPV